MDELSHELMSESELGKSEEEAPVNRLATFASDNESSQKSSFEEEVTEVDTIMESESDGTAVGQQCSLVDDESSNSGFIVIKPNAAVVEKDMERKQDEEEHQTSNVIVIQNSTEVSLEGLDSTVLNQVQRALEESGLEHSVMILNGDESADVEHGTPYIIDLNTEDKSHIPNFTVSVSERLPSPSVQSVVSTPSSSASMFTKLVNQDNSSDNFSSEQVLPSSPSRASVTVVDSFETRVTAENSDIPSSSVDPCIIDSSEQNKKAIKTLSLFLPDSPLSTPKNLIQSMSSHNQSNSHSSSIDEKQHTSNSTTTHVAEQLLNIAKKMIEEGGSTSQRISVDEAMSKIVISPEQKSSKEKSSESVITMYLSSPNELKSKLEKFKTDSPVIIVQAGEEPLTEEEEGDDGSPENVIKEESRTPITRGEVIERTGSPYGTTETTLHKSSDSSISQSDSLAAALSSFAADSVLYSCSECGYSSHNKHYYKQHVDLVHNEERPYKCSHCDYAGKRRHALLEHMVVHSDQRPYSCSYCNASFRKKGHLTNHVKLHTSQRLVHCGVCNIQLPDAEAFESHLHKIHNTDKLYKCKLCDHTVVNRQAMLTHLSSHNEGVLFFCSNCSSHFDEEKTLQDHMKEVHGIVRLKEETASSLDKLSQFSQNPAAAAAATAAGDVKSSKQANIICSECRFVCTDAEVMKRHMWIHIDSPSNMNIQIKGQAASSGVSTPTSSAMGILKMNVVSGLKTLPENVVYQCTSCNFTSSDNSVFIKHMLLHKTQRKNLLPTAKSGEYNQPSESMPNERSPGKTISVLPSASQPLSSGNLKVKPVNNVPFVFDDSSGRFRCLICGYHCDYQRTIKAHIWKHSGHQNIEYPVFDQAKQMETVPPLASSSGSGESQLKPVIASTSSLPSASFAAIPFPVQPMQLLKTSSGDIVKLLPVDPKTTKYKPGDLIQIKDNAIIVSDKCEKDSPADLFLKSMTVQAKSENVASETLSNSNAHDDVNPVICEALQSEEKIESSSSKVSTLSIHQDKMSQLIKTECTDKSDLEKEGCTEPNVVVEIVDTVPSGLGLTGLRSQQCSPRVSDLDSSGGEQKLSTGLKDAFFSEKSSSEKAFHQNEQETGKGFSSEKASTEKAFHENEQETGKRKYNLRKPRDQKKIKILSHSQDESNTPSMVGGDNDSKDMEEAVVLEKNVVYLKPDKNYPAKPEVIEEAELSNSVESDTTESSDEIGSAGESGSSSNPPKTGICSSLLAVIEQLRERSRSEGEKSISPTKELPKRVSKKEKKQSSPADTAPLCEFHNIEKINAGDGEKYRCCLCHYTSQRICNMKIHMKTHRQKKPSECSLCDFSSSVPEALQEHMLQHCKVRTYACKFCPQIFYHKSTLRAHMRAHKDKEPFLCAYCVFEASTSTELKEHMQVHSGCSSRLRCPTCDHIVNNKEELTSHLMKCSCKNDYATMPATGSMKHEEVTKPEETSSSIVVETNTDVEFSVNSSSDATMSSSTEHACVVSGCSFTSCSLKELQEHLSVHCNPSLLVCDLCDFKALHTRSLKSHMKRHSNDQRYVQQPLEQYKCNLCGYVCHHLPSLKSHMWRHASDESYSYEFTNDVINAAIDHDSRVDANAGEADDPELLDRVINSERKIMEGELTKSGQRDGQRPTCWVTFRCCSCGFDTINKAKLNIHMRSHSDIIKQTLDGVTRKPGQDKSNHTPPVAVVLNKSPNKRLADAVENDEPSVSPKHNRVN